MKRPFSVQSAGKTLEGVIVERKNSSPSLLFLHGAGNATKERAMYLATRCLQNRVSSCCFDFSGYGKSTGIKEESSLATQYEEACDISPFLDGESPMTLCGSSMGGYVAVKLLQFYRNVKTLILFCPALYDAKAFNIPFTEEFSECIRQPESWKNTDMIPLMENFHGNVIIIQGENDTVIPQGVIDLYMKSFKKARHKDLIKVPKADHQIHNFLQANKSAQDMVFKRIKKFI